MIKPQIQIQSGLGSRELSTLRRELKLDHKPIQPLLSTRESPNPTQIQRLPDPNSSLCLVSSHAQESGSIDV